MFIGVVSSQRRTPFKSLLTLWIRTQKGLLSSVRAHVYLHIVIPHEPLPAFWKAADILSLHLRRGFQCTHFKYIRKQNRQSRKMAPRCMGLSKSYDSTTIHDSGALQRKPSPCSSAIFFPRRPFAGVRQSHAPKPSTYILQTTLKVQACDRRVVTTPVSLPRFSSSSFGGHS